MLQRDLASARSALQKQWRELSSSFEDQLRHLELDCNNRVEQASQQMELALQQASERESEAAAAHSKERTATDAAAVSPLLLLCCIEHASQAQRLSWACMVYNQLSAEQRSPSAQNKSCDLSE